MSGSMKYRQQTYQWEMPKQLAQPASGTIPVAPGDFGRRGEGVRAIVGHPEPANYGAGRKVPQHPVKGLPK